MRISVIIPAFNEERLLGATLRSIQSALTVFSRRNWETELIVCDNNSTDRTAEIACAAGATVVFEPINQIARARNRGAEGATGDWFLFMDADSHPSPELFDEVAALMEADRCLAIGCTMKFDGHHPRASLVVKLWNRVSRTFRWLAGSFVLCKATAFRKIGGFSTELFASEEIDLSIRLKKLARKEGKKVLIVHRHPITTSSRKLHLYTPREHAAFLLKTIFARGKTLRSREACPTWYDGRR